MLLYSNDKLQSSKLLLPFKVLCCEIQNLQVTDQKIQLLKASIKKSEHSPFNSYTKNNVALNLTKEELAP